jgi:hypothetical protein
MITPQKYKKLVVSDETKEKLKLLGLCTKPKIFASGTGSVLFSFLRNKNAKNALYEEFLFFKRPTKNESLVESKKEDYDEFYDDINSRSFTVTLAENEYVMARLFHRKENIHDESQNFDDIYIGEFLDLILEGKLEFKERK